MTVPVILIGALGRMGAEIGKCIANDGGVELKAAVESPSHPDIGKEYGACIGVGDIGIEVSAELTASMCTKENVAIHFSTPQQLPAFFDMIGTHGMKAVVGTTGFDDGVEQKMRECSQKTALLYSPNMSMGVNLLFYLTRIAAEGLISAFDVEIIEAHHRRKKDSPSGTAKRLGEIVASAMKLDYETHVMHGRAGNYSEGRSRKEIGMHAVRGGGITGDHTVLFAGEGERIELKHTAHTRATFAQGAVEAAKWLYNRPTGLYSMQDMLGIG